MLLLGRGIGPVLPAIRYLIVFLVLPLASLFSFAFLSVERGVMQPGTFSLELGMRPYIALSCLFLGRHYAGCGRHEDARRQMKESESLRREMGMNFWLPHVCDLRQRLEAGGQRKLHSSSSPFAIRKKILELQINKTQRGKYHQVSLGLCVAWKTISDPDPRPETSGNTNVAVRRDP